MTGPLAFVRAKIIERWNQLPGTASTIVKLLVLDPDWRRDVLVPAVETEREELVYDQSVNVTGRISWLFRSVAIEYNRPFTRRERKRLYAVHDRMAAAETRERNDEMFDPVRFWDGVFRWWKEPPGGV